MESTESATERLLRGLNAHDPDAIRTALHQDFHYEEVARPGAPSIEAFVTEMQIVFSGLPNVSFVPVRQTEVSERLYVEFRAFGTHQGDFLNVPATGTTAYFGGVFNVEAHGGSIVRLRMTVDFGGLRRQLLLAARAL